jgi:outer membrane protein OmpA-like peptidoglycan-associated protein
MSSQTNSAAGRVFVTLAASFALLCLFTNVAAAQDGDRPLPKWEIYGGYSVFYPNATVSGQRPGALAPLSSMLETNPNGIGITGAYNFNRWFALEIDYSNHWGSGETTLATRIDDTRFDNISIGPKITFRSKRFSPFVEALVGDHRLVPEGFHSVDKLGFMFGAGLDANLSRHIAWRVLRADFVGSTYRFGPGATVPTTDVRGARFQTGLNFMFGGDDHQAVRSAACSVQPTDVYAGEPVTATASGTNFNPKRTITYTWSGTGVKTSGNGSSTQVDTAGLSPGSYRVAASLNDGSRRGVASCNASFTVRQPNGPTIACSSNPSTVQPGGSSTITSNASSPDNRNLTYSYSTSAGDISGNRSSTTLRTVGAQPGTITVTCNVADDRNPALTASATTNVNVEAPPPPAPAPPPPSAPIEASRLNQIDFKQGSPRVDNTAKAILDDVALRLQRDADSKAVLVGEANPSESANKTLASRRAANTKAYLVNEKGIDASRLETRTGTDAAQQTQIWLVPAGATFNDNGTRPTKR